MGARGPESFYYLEPNKFKQVSRMVTESRFEREEYLDQVISVLRGEMDKVSRRRSWGCPKHLYSIYQKMAKKGQGLLRDLRPDRRAHHRQVGEGGPRRWARCIRCGTPCPGGSKTTSPCRSSTCTKACTPRWPPAGAGGADPHRGDAPPKRDGVAAHWRYKEKGGRGGNDSMDKQPAWLREMVDGSETHDSRASKDLKVSAHPRCSCSRRRARP